MCVALVLGTVPDASCAQDAMGGGAARDWERRSAEAEPARRTRAERRLRMEQSRAHARMPSRMYASTPDPSFPPHPVPLDVSSGRAEAPARASARPAAARVHRIALFPAAARWRQLGYQGFARIINRSAESGTVRIEAFDDTGRRAPAVTLDVGAGEAVHFNSDDLEAGNAGKGLGGATGAGEGDWRLELTSALDLEVLAYIRTRDGFLTGMHDRAPRTATGHRVVIFNPGRNTGQVSRLRLVNPGAEAASVRIEGIDGKGESPGGAVELSVPAGAARTLSARQLESGGAGLTGALGTGSGKWRLVVSSAQAIEVMSLLSSPTGHLTNLSTVPSLSTVPGPGSDDTLTVGTVWLFPAAARWRQLGYQGFARIINRSAESGTVRIEAFDDTGRRAPAVTLDVGAGEAVHFNSDDLEAGNAGKGLDGATGAGVGDWRLELTSGLDLEVLAYIRTQDGFLTSMHDVVPRTAAGHQVVIFNPGRNTGQASRLRLVNPGAEAASVRIEGIDGKGESPGGAVELSVPARAARTLGAAQLESGGAGLTGALGTGSGKWRLVVSSAQAIEVMSLLSSPTGHLTNLSTVPVRTESAAQVFRSSRGPSCRGSA